VTTPTAVAFIPLSGDVTTKEGGVEYLYPPLIISIN